MKLLLSHSICFTFGNFVLKCNAQMVVIHPSIVCGINCSQVLTSWYWHCSLLMNSRFVHPNLRITPREPWALYIWLLVIIHIAHPLAYPLNRVLLSLSSSAFKFSSAQILPLDDFWYSYLYGALLLHLCAWHKIAQISFLDACFMILQSWNRVSPAYEQTSFIYWPAVYLPH